MIAPPFAGRIEPLRVPIRDGRAELAGTLAAPAGKAPALVTVHGASDGTRDFFLFEHLRRVLPPAGIAVFSFDRRGEGDSGGASPNGDLGVLADDVVAALERVAASEAVDAERIALWGFSQGGWIAPLAAARSARVRALVLLASTGVSPADQMRYAAAFHLRRAGYGEDVVERAVSLRRAVEDVLRGGSPHEAQALVDAARAEPWFPLAFVPIGDDGRVPPSGSWPDMDFDPLETFARVRVPVLLFYGEDDEWSPVDPSVAAWQRAAERSGNGDVTAVRLPGTGHHPTLGGGESLEAVSPLYEAELVRWLRDRLVVRDDVSAAG